MPARRSYALTAIRCRIVTYFSRERVSPDLSSVRGRGRTGLRGAGLHPLGVLANCAASLRLWKACRYHRAVVVLARREGKKAVQARLCAQGLRLQHFSVREIGLLAEDYLAQHRAELIAEAEQKIATSPEFAQWRLPPAQQVWRPGNQRLRLCESQVQNGGPNDRWLCQGQHGRSNARCSTRCPNGSWMRASVG